MAARAAARPAPKRAATRAGLDRLWAPWRMEYIGRAEKETGCLFCRVGKTGGARVDARDLVLARTANALLMLNRYPYNPGHLMVAVKRHAAQFHELSAAERGELLDLTALAERALAAEYAPHGVNYGLNVGRVAGAGFPGHLHLHLVPRWNGDTNFMPALAQTRVLPESLTRTWARLRKAIAVLAAAGAAPGTAPRRAVRRAAAAPKARRGA